MIEKDRAKAYSRRRHALFFIYAAIKLFILAFIQTSGLSLYFKTVATGIIGNYYGALFVYLGLFSLSISIVSLPLEFYSGFFLEHAFGLSHQTLTMWIKDEVKKGLVFFTIFSALIEAVYLVLKTFPGTWWIFASCGWIMFSIFFSKVFPLVIIPLFYTYKAIDDEGLRTRILGLTKKARISVTDVVEINMSKDTKKSNAAFVGWGKTRRIILADNLLREHSPDEIGVVVAHEMAHCKFRHLWKLTFFSSLSVVASFYAFHALSGKAAFCFGVTDMYDISIFPFLNFVFALIGLIFLPIYNTYSRNLERDADRFALALTGMKGAFISLMEKLADTNLADREPNRVIEFLLYDHPSVSRRIEYARSFREEEPAA